MFTRTFGEAGTVRTGKDGNLDDFRVTVMFLLVCAEEHEGENCRMLNPQRSSAMETCAVIWLHDVYYKGISTSVTNSDPTYCSDRGR